MYYSHSGMVTMASKVLCGFLLLSSFLVLLSSGCPSECKCPRDKKVVCSDMLITNVPSGIPEDTEILELSQCDIKNISMDSFKNLSNLIAIEIKEQKSGLNLQDAAIFQGLEKLQRVYLDGNGIVSLPEGLFANLSSLVTVHLNDNPLTTLPDDLFQNSPNLKFLSLVNTKLSKEVLAKIGQGTFAANIEALSLQGTPIQNLLSNFFSGLKNLKILVLRNCQINYIREDVLKGTKVTSIDFGENPIKTIDVNAFRGINSPAGISLKFPKCNLTTATIQNIPVLDSLFLENNKISHIPKDAFKNLKSLHLIKLSNNLIETIDENPFAELPKCSDTLCPQLDGNPLNCDCKMAWLHKWTENWDELARKSLKCTKPEKVAGKNFAELKPSQFCCLNGTKCGNMTPTTTTMTTTIMTTAKTTGNRTNEAMIIASHFITVTTHLIFLQLIFFLILP